MITVQLDKSVGRPVLIIGDKRYHLSWSETSRLGKECVRVKEPHTRMVERHFKFPEGSVVRAKRYFSCLAVLLPLRKRESIRKGQKYLVRKCEEHHGRNFLRVSTIGKPMRDLQALWPIDLFERT